MIQKMNMNSVHEVADKCLKLTQQGDLEQAELLRGEWFFNFAQEALDINALLPLPVTQLSYEPSHGGLDSVLQGEPSVLEFEQLKHIFKAEVRTSPIARFLFQYFYKDLSRFLGNVEVRFSSIPKNFYPKTCLVSGCRKAADFESTGRNIPIYCKDHKDSGKPISTTKNKLFNAFEEAFFNRSFTEQKELSKRYKTVWNGYKELCRYIGPNYKDYVPRGDELSEIAPQFMGLFFTLTDERPFFLDTDDRLRLNMGAFPYKLPLDALCPSKGKLWHLIKGFSNPNDDCSDRQVSASYFDEVAISRAVKSNSFLEVMKQNLDSRLTPLDSKFRLISSLESPKSKSPLGYELEENPEEFITLRNVKPRIVSNQKAYSP